MLVGDRNAELAHARRSWAGHFLAGDGDLTSIGRQDAGGDADQCRLPCAVLADDGVDFAPRRGEIDTLEGAHDAEGLLNAAELQPIRGFVRRKGIAHVMIHRANGLRRYAGGARPPAGQRR